MVTTDSLDFSIKTDIFEGPLELLIELVEKRKLLINDISLASVTDEYLARVSAMQERSLPNTTQFVQLASTLLLIKSKSLLPILELTKEEETIIDDLGERLKQYQIYRTAGQYLASIFNVTTLYSPKFTPPKEPLFIPDSWCELETLNQVIKEVITNLPKKIDKPKVQVKPTISLEQMMTKLKERIEQHLRTKFSDLKTEAEDHKTVIVGFLAILELVKQGNILAKQTNRFADIEMELEQSDVPRYF